MNNNKDESPFPVLTNVVTNLIWAAHAFGLLYVLSYVITIEIIAIIIVVLIVMRGVYLWLAQLGE